MHFSVFAVQLIDERKPPPREFVLNQELIPDLDRSRRLLPDQRMWPPELNDGASTSTGPLRVSTMLASTNSSKSCLSAPLDRARRPGVCCHADGLLPAISRWRGFSESDKES